LKQVQNWFAEFMPGLKTKIVSLSATYQHDDPRPGKIKANAMPRSSCRPLQQCSPAVATHAITLETRYAADRPSIPQVRPRVTRSPRWRVADARRAFVPMPSWQDDRGN